jgi:hypothetical protein
MKAYLVIMIIIFAAALVSDPDKPLSEHAKRWGKAIQLMLLLWTAILLAGCSGSTSPTEAPRTTITVYTMPANWYDVAEFRLTDGTRCVMTQASGGGITCEWRKPNVPAAVEVE